MNDFVAFGGPLLTGCGRRPVNKKAMFKKFPLILYKRCVHFYVCRAVFFYVQSLDCMHVA